MWPRWNPDGGPPGFQPGPASSTGTGALPAAAGSKAWRSQLADDRSDSFVVRFLGWRFSARPCVMASRAKISTTPSLTPSPSTKLATTRSAGWSLGRTGPGTCSNWWCWTAPPAPRSSTPCQCGPRTGDCCRRQARTDMNNGQHENGTPITEADTDALADEAERGYDVDTLLRRRRGGGPR